MVTLWTDEPTWDAAVAAVPRSPFLQSWGWGAFQNAVGRPVWRFGVVDAGTLTGGLQAIGTPLPFGQQYLYAPRGPFSVRGSFPWRDALALMRAQTPSGAFLRTDFALGQAVILDGAIRLAPLQPRHTLFLNLQKEEEALLAAMHEKTRYNIRLAERKGVQVSSSTAATALDAFLALLGETEKRDRIRMHAPSYYRAMVQRLAPLGLLKIWTASFERQPIAANLVVSFGDTVTYLHGASANAFRNVMAPHLLQWRQIQDAKARGFRWYDFWGVAPEGARGDDPWTGITRFKLGFGGERVSSPTAALVPLRPWLTRAYRFVRWLRRRKI